MQFNTDFFVRLDESHIIKKIEMLDCYMSQGHRPFLSKQYVRDIARTRGLQIKQNYAECFEFIRGVSL